MKIKRSYIIAGLLLVAFWLLMRPKMALASEMEPSPSPNGRPERENEDRGGSPSPSPAGVKNWARRKIAKLREKFA